MILIAPECNSCSCAESGCQDGLDDVYGRCRDAKQPCGGEGEGCCGDFGPPCNSDDLACDTSDNDPPFLAPGPPAAELIDDDDNVDSEAGVPSPAPRSDEIAAGGPKAAPSAASAWLAAGKCAPCGSVAQMPCKGALYCSLPT